MNILAIKGSPKKDGTSSTITDDLIKKIENAKNKIKTYDLNSLNIHGCQECYSCRNNKTDKCIVNDDITEILESAKTTDVIIVSTPVFYSDISAQLKCFIDRTWSYFGKTGTSADHLPRNRTLVFILSYGYNNPDVYNQLYEKYKHYFNLFGFNNCYLIKAYGVQYNSSNVININEVNDLLEKVSKKINDDV